MDPTNFVVRAKPASPSPSSHHRLQTATWLINSLIVYRKQTYTSPVAMSGALVSTALAHGWTALVLAAAGAMAGFSVYV
jgi:hypothetical protein